ncbi:Aldehyde/histidinol dehydrogenase [Podospora didyma]|uniref:Aldehyde/histidinol dehydrogenase n=1 Tax=Podospora didyma TaxID=330526 RepID=A0AAE0NCI7_9PEZI|nr:Aldehyde/histidinol dehydrogenase [Podospora didyma]
MNRSSSSKEAALERVEAAAIEGRTENIRYRQDQLQKLHQALSHYEKQICDALLQDSSSSPEAADELEVAKEFYWGMTGIRHFYDELDFGKELENEYRVANGQDNVARRVGVGVVVIRPTTHTRFWSVVSPLAAAIAAGNCVVLELDETGIHIDSVLSSALASALDWNTFHVISKTTDSSGDDIKLSLSPDVAVLFVNQNGDNINNPAAFTSTRQEQPLVSPAKGRAVAVVDRTANIEEAARAIVRARLSFGGTSPYAPDLVLVNEFVKEQFVQSCSRYAMDTLAAKAAHMQTPFRLLKKVSSADHDEKTTVIQNLKSARDESMTFVPGDFKLVEVRDKNIPRMNKKISGFHLSIVSCSGLVDSIFTHQFEKPLLAGYFFAEPRAAKYLSQHLSCRISFINQIPEQLLLGPAAPIYPSFTQEDYVYRYNREMFSVPRPQLIDPVPEPLERLPKSAIRVRALGTLPLRTTEQPGREMGDFFLSGLFLGAGFALTVVLPVVGWTSYVLGSKGLRFVMRMRRG